MGNSLAACMAEASKLKENKHVNAQERKISQAAAWWSQ